MWIQRKALLLLTGLMMTAPFACADNGALVDFPSQTGQNAQYGSTSRIDKFGRRFSLKIEKSYDMEPAYHHEFKDVLSKSPPLEGKPSVDFHSWVNTHHPVLEYRFSEQGTAHLHLTRHRAITSADWKF